MSPGKQALHADVLIQLGPVQALPLPDESPACSFRACTMREPRVPGEGNRNRPPIDEVHHERIVCERDALRPRLADINR